MLVKPSCGEVVTPHSEAGFTRTNGQNGFTNPDPDFVTINHWVDDSTTLVKASLGESVTLLDAAILLEAILVESVTLQDASTTQKPTSDRAAL